MTSSNNLNNYLQSSKFIDWDETSVQELAMNLAGTETNNEIISRKCFEFVRDQIKHSMDFQLNPVTCKASDVLKYRTGFCYAKSHLLAALLRANGIPAGLCYQRLKNTDGITYCLHGLNAVYLDRSGWYRIDPRGNNETFFSEFCPPRERLAFSLTEQGEIDLHEIYTEPLEIIINVLSKHQTTQQVAANLPDIDLVLSRGN